ncbi:hypothetical protein [Natrarchaeobius chitinivorans]|uniref:Uncharacterized protein n=1 Tax=Natrarchaeobius chitinivorans TaxID=1679083 RepID=A0A3N6M1L9_NATCH|nr:hypothetical protein [Natrarchaeobius chitinivorans]RQG89660.1 hypothetical protein EA473_21655 [Natrarchaeobius chitinivorans]
MAQTVRLSDALYQAINESRSEDQSFQDVIEEMAIETGVLGDVSTLSELHPSLQSLYGYNDEEIHELLDILRVIYTAEAEAPYDTINFPDYNYESWTLYDLGLRQSSNSQRLTPAGRDVASEAVEQFIETNMDDILDVLDDYNDKILLFFVNYGLNRLGSGHLTTHDSTFSSDRDAPWQTDEITNTYQKFIGDLRELNIAVSVSSTVSYGNIEVFTVLPPEFESFILEQISVDEDEVMRKIEVYKALTDYIKGNVNSRNEMLDQLDSASESDLVEEISRLHEEDLTSKYLEDQPKSPLMVKNIEKTLSQIESNMEAELN